MSRIKKMQSGKKSAKNIIRVNWLEGNEAYGINIRHNSPDEPLLIIGQMGFD